jgi:hypothetical protein
LWAVVKFQSLYGDVPARLSAIFDVWLVPAASTGWKDALAGLNSAALSSAYSEGGSPSLDVSVVNPEWHLKQSWYSRVSTSVAPFRNVYVGAAPALPLTTDAPETPASCPGAVHPVVVWTPSVVLASWALWQFEHWLLRLLTPPNSFRADSVFVLGARASWE